MQIERLSIPEVLLITPDYCVDERGYSFESLSLKQLQSFSQIEPIQFCYHSQSKKAGTLRGIHYQLPPMAQAKIVKCLNGAVWDVAVDLRPESDTFQKWVGVELSHKNHRQLYIPEGFGHAFVTLQDDTEVLYLMNRYFSSEWSRVLAWNDPSLGITWTTSEPILSEKDRAAPNLADTFL